MGGKIAKKPQPQKKTHTYKKTAHCPPDTLQAERGLPPYLRYCAPLIEICYVSAWGLHGASAMQPPCACAKQAGGATNTLA